MSSSPATADAVTPPETPTTSTAADRLLRIGTVYAEPEARDSERGQQILSRFPGAEVIEVPSHWQIPELHGNEGNVERWVRVKSGTLVLGVKKSLSARPNGRSSDFIAPSTSNGCAMACAYCYVPRRKGYANPITVFTNIDKITRYLRGHVRRQGVKPEPDQVDPHAWVYDIGENSDCSVDALVSDNVADLVATFRELPTAKASFATKFVNRELLDLDPQGRTRVRFSLMPENDAKLLDIRTSPVPERIAAIDDFVAAGYEVHLNFSPIVLREGWERDWAELLTRLDDEVGAAAKEQAAAEIIMLTHNRDLHEVNLGWHPKAEDLLWRPDIQQPKRSQSGMWNVRYRNAPKREAVARVQDLIAAHAPWIRVRYAF
ncbi:spore photoproduct lyase family protein [Pseudonocardia sp. KRD-184]|uniref:Spore photoproduct lyase family protein n=2 Tax=Pseudonocardia oceani TaxID=2792013 RepID=A0ABS6UHS2_9PSEU|nr:spore photoproduct lyase family protein [Pseudonocardia oceani]MBW0097830.1 spore photoproduct lyase family protein [Pseudonocardia oceani]MBW0112567.1 spore photoproduct lyase family protein [Pseudonocardia oceani]MBW0124418.1 spore photoproduct lyase family protein [Pseudonocardia oceani]MBW0131795.1 spore photoproduct lyase family protein [Pseudonocardia oceani]